MRFASLFNKEFKWGHPQIDKRLIEEAPQNRQAQWDHGHEMNKALKIVFFSP